MPSFWCTLSTTPRLPLRQHDVIARGKFYVMTSLFFAVSVLNMLKYNSHKRRVDEIDRIPHLHSPQHVRALRSEEAPRQAMVCG